MQDIPLTVGSILRHAVSYFGDGEVVTAAERSSRRASYAAVSDRIAQLAAGLRRLGIRSDERVGTFQWNNQEHLEAYFAVPAMGAVLHTLNLRLFPEQVVYIVNHAEDSVVILDASLIQVFAKLLPECKSVHTVLVCGDGDRAPLESSGKQILSYEDVLAAESPDFAWPDVDERSAAAMCYTSGTTGNPKGVVYSHRSTWLHSSAVCSANGLGLRYDDRVLPIVPMFHANAWGLPYAAFMSGASLVMPDRFLQAEPLLRLIEAERPTVAGAVPTIWNDILHYIRANPGHDLSCLRQVACGGSAVPRTLMQAFEDEFKVRIIQAWGMTETSPLASVAWVPVGVEGQEEFWRYRSTAGRLLSGVEGRIVDDAGTELPRDGRSVGELEVRGPWVTAAYYRDEDPSRFDQGWLRTGDVGTLDERGYITLTDRAKDVIKSGGEWISSVELETTLAAHPDVLEAAVVGVPDERWQERPLAVVVPKPDISVEPTVLRDWLSGKVARWWLPERWAFVPAVPRTSVGKFDKKVLRRAYADGELEVTVLEPAAADSSPPAN
jgi:fatty-acyl-CoA synthase